MAYDQKKVVEALRAFERGEIVVVMDDDGRENEGDLIVAAVHCTPENMAFTMRPTSGNRGRLMAREDALSIKIQLMVAVNDAPDSSTTTVLLHFQHRLTTL